MADLVPATGDYLRQILTENYSIWNDGLTLEAYVRFWDAQLLTPWGGAHLDRVAVLDGGHVACSAKRYDLSARIDGRIRRVLGIGAVFTSPSRRKQGWARRLMELLLETAEAEGYEFALLFSEIDPAFYECFDFVPIRLYDACLKFDRKDRGPAILVRSGDDRDIPAIAEMSAKRTESFRFVLDRSEDWIRYGIAKRRLLAGLGPPGLREIEFLVVEEGHQAVAFAVVMIHKGRWFLEDAGDRDPAGARLGAMLQAMQTRTPHLELPVIRAWLPHGFIPPQLPGALMVPNPDVMMIRPLRDRTLPLPPLDLTQLSFCRLDYF